MRRVPAALLLLLLPACSGLVDAYKKEYVLYEPESTRPAPGSPAEGFARLLELEALRAEIERAILDGHDGDGALARRRDEVAAAAQRHRDALGPALGDLRRARIEELRRLEVK